MAPRAKPAQSVATPTGSFPTFDEIGSSGLKQWGGRIAEEFLQELKGERGRRVLREMSLNDPTISACLGTTRQFLRQVPIHIDRGSDERAGELIETALADMSRTWSDTLSEILTFLVYGWQLSEIVYKRRGGDVEDSASRSRYSDGLIGWRKFAPRSQESLQSWEFAADGSLRGMVQVSPSTNRTATIPIEKALLFRTDSTCDSPEGRSILRSAYQAWYFAKRIKMIEGIGIERDLAGLPTVRVPGSMIAKGGADLETWRSMGRNIRRDEQECLVLPSDTGKDGKYTHTVELLTSGGKRNFDTDVIVKRYQVEIAMSLLADFILLGHEQSGSWALATSKTDVYTLALAGWIDTILEVFNLFAIPRLMKLNGLQVDVLPTIKRGEIAGTNLTELGAYIQQVGGVFPEVGLVPGLLDALLRAPGLPTQETAEEVGKMARQSLKRLGLRPFREARDAAAEVIKAYRSGSDRAISRTARKRTSASRPVIDDDDDDDE
jgi:hypothetical protein